MRPKAFLLCQDYINLGATREFHSIQPLKLLKKTGGILNQLRYFFLNSDGLKTEVVSILEFTIPYGHFESLLIKKLIYT